MPRFKITSPVADYTGSSAGVAFVNGEALLDTGEVGSENTAQRKALAYFRQAGYGEVEIDEAGNAVVRDPETGEVVVDEVEAEQLPAVPPVSSTKDVLLDAAVLRGYDRAEADALNKNDLHALLVKHDEEGAQE